MVKHLTSVESEQKKTISDLEADILACHNKEAELLAFSEKMTAKNAQLQSEASGTVAKVKSKLNVIIINNSERTREQEYTSTGSSPKH